MGHTVHDFLTKNLQTPMPFPIEQPPKPLWKCLLSEIVGTFLLIFIGCGAGIRLSSGEEFVGQPFVGIALCWAFVISALAQSLGHYSCDINPSITLANLVTRKTTIVKAISYIIVQCFGCTLGAYALKLTMPPQPDDNYGMTKLVPDITPVQGVFLEIIATSLLAFTVFAANDERRTDLKGSIPLSIGLCVGSIILSVGPITGASLNPARSFGPCLVARNFENHWVFWLGPICGGILDGILYHIIYRENEVPRERRDSDAEDVPPASV